MCFKKAAQRYDLQVSDTTVLLFVQQLGTKKF